MNTSPAPLPEAPAPEEAKVFWLEPSTKTIIGTNQIIHVYAVLKLATDLYPKYINLSESTISIADTAIISVDQTGGILGLKEGETKIAIQYKEYRSEVAIQVSGRYERKSINVPGQGQRFFDFYSPPNVVRETAAPLLLSFHGGGGNSSLQAETSQLNAVAAAKGFYVAYPEGTGAIRTFNAGACCVPAKTSNVDDVQFSKMLIEQIQAEVQIDQSKIFASGFSNGAIMVHRLACELSDIISGIAAVGGGSGEFDFLGNQYYTCIPNRTIPVLQIHAVNDRNYPLAGGQGEGSSGTEFFPIMATIENVRIRNNLSTQNSIELVSSITNCQNYSAAMDSGKPSARVTLCESKPLDLYEPITEVVFGGGHSWPGGMRSTSSKSDVPSPDYKASEFIWNFLTK